MTFPAYSRFDFHKDGNAARRDRDAEPRVLVIGPAWHPETDELLCVLMHFAGDPYSREVPAHAINVDLIKGMTPEQAFDLGRLVEGGELGLPEVYA